ncbi:uncharacterized protein BO97DRAFT_479393 [Aspergillus homomorphus CBS 101889]|uniref:Uncharacterized protein n=1 Tax=Aspergillus homomorphus (strain CBS 101889) TaxID=1450537 RepID=A0A395HU73_ASPHC|nr:hypothetical protein BO97DRAFT_479393 [Aspergillus homomorphus CBS 101889]RAL10378.1 hypothetical protein BO97DRAFT_479393 [Aspergillus homomorphus CBS 101889]
MFPLYHPRAPLLHDGPAFETHEQRRTAENFDSGARQHLVAMSLVLKPKKQRRRQRGRRGKGSVTVNNLPPGRAPAGLNHLHSPDRRTQTTQWLNQVSNTESPSSSGVTASLIRLPQPSTVPIPHQQDHFLPLSSSSLDGESEEFPAPDLEFPVRMIASSIPEQYSDSSRLLGYIQSTRQESTHQAGDHQTSPIMASRKLLHSRQDSADSSQLDLGQTDDHELHNLNQLASSRVGLLDLYLKTSSKNKGTRAQKQCLSESAAGVSIGVASSASQGLVSGRFSTFRQPSSNVLEAYKDHSASKMLGAQKYVDNTFDSPIDLKVATSRPHTADSPESTSRPSSMRQTISACHDDTLPYPSTPTRVKRYNYSESYLSPVPERGDSEFRLSATGQYKPSARLSRFDQSNDNDVGCYKDNLLTPTRLGRQKYSEAKSDQGWYGAGNRHIQQNPLSYSRSSNISYSSPHVPSRSFIAESPFQRRDDNLLGDRTVWPTKPSSQGSSYDMPRTGSLSHESVSEESCPPASSLHLYGANFDQTYNRSPYESLRVQQERFKRAESRRISSGLQFPMSGSQQGHISELPPQAIAVLSSQISGVSSFSNSRVPPELLSSQRRATNVHKSTSSSNGSSGLSAEEKRRIFKEEVNALLKSAENDLKSTKLSAKVERLRVESPIVKAPSTGENQTSAHHAAGEPIIKPSANTGTQKAAPEEVETTSWGLLERAASNLEKGTTASGRPSIPRYRPQNIYQARRFAGWGDLFNTGSSFTDTEPFPNTVSAERARNVFGGITSIDLKKQASAYIQNQILMSGNGSQSATKDALWQRVVSSELSKNKPLKPPPGLPQPPSQLANRPTWYLDSLIQNQARLEESNAWFQRDGRGDEALRAQVSLFAQDYGEQLKERGLPTKDCESAQEMSELIGNALVNLSSYVIGGREQQAGNFANFTPAPSDCSSPRSDMRRTFFDLDPFTECEAPLDRNYLSSPGINHVARRRTSSAINPFIVLEDDSDIESDW